MQYSISRKVLKAFLSNHTTYQLEKQLVQLAICEALLVAEGSVVLRLVPEISEVTNRQIDRHTHAHTQNTCINIIED